MHWVSIVSVDVSPDLGSARIYYSCMPATEAAEDPEGIQAGLEHAAGYLRSQLGRSLSLRSVPELRFEPDTSLEHGDYMNRLLRSLDTGDSDDRE
jgi:ribosome-binding factor A